MCGYSLWYETALIKSEWGAMLTHRGLRAQGWNPSLWSIEKGCIFPSNQRAGPQRMHWLPGLCHPVSAWAQPANSQPPETLPTPTQTLLHPKRSPMQQHGWGCWRWMVPHSGKHCLSKCVLLANTPHAWPHDWLIIFKTTASDLPSANPTQQGFGLTQWRCFL